MARFLIILGVIIIATGLLWPFLTKLGIGRLPATSSSSAAATRSIFR